MVPQSKSIGMSNKDMKRAYKEVTQDGAFEMMVAFFKNNPSVPAREAMGYGVIQDALEPLIQLAKEESE